MAQTDFDNKILFVDDEQFINIWIKDFLESTGYEVECCENLDDALDRIEEGIYRAAIFDLNVPASSSLREQLIDKGNVYDRYPGLYAADLARNKGFRGRQVIIYSVHKNEEVADVAKTLNCTYLLKERPPLFIAELKAVLAFDPTRQIED